MPLPDPPRLSGRPRATNVGHDTGEPTQAHLHAIASPAPVVSTPTPAASFPPVHPDHVLRAQGQASADPHAHAHAHTHAHSHAHAHAHSHGGTACDGDHGLLHSHHHDWSHLALAGNGRRMLWLALLVQGGFLLVEVVGGLLTNSLALLGDAAHMVADVGALALALFAANLAARPVSARHTWGMPRAEVVAAVVNSLTLVFSCAWIAIEAVRRFLAPEAVDAHGLVGIAVLGLLANVVGAWLLARADRDNVNIRAAMAHLMLDAASSVGVIIAGIVIALGGPVAIDGIASLLIAWLAVRGTWPVLMSAMHSLLDAAPQDADAASVARSLMAVPCVTAVHDLHVWEPGPRRVAATAHVLVQPGTDVGAAIAELRRVLVTSCGIEHATLQVAIDRRHDTYAVVGRLPREAAIERAVALVRATLPAVPADRAAAAVVFAAAHVHPAARCSPIGLLVRARTILEERQGRHG